MQRIEESRYLHVDARGRVTLPQEVRDSTGIPKDSFVCARVCKNMVVLTHVTPSEAAQMSAAEVLDFIRAALPKLTQTQAKAVMAQLLEKAYQEVDSCGTC